MTVDEVLLNAQQFGLIGFDWYEYKETPYSVERKYTDKALRLIEFAMWVRRRSGEGRLEVGGHNSEPFLS